MVTSYAALESALVSGLGPLGLIAVSYLSAAPLGVEQFAGTVPSGCTFWKRAATGNGFYTVPGDHLNCPIGSYTHAIDLPTERAAELGQALTLMAGIGYVRMEEVPSIPRLQQPPAFIYYAPLGNAVVPPDVVIVSGRPGPLMRLQEAAAHAGAAAALPMLGRPTCMALPAAMANGVVMSSGCIGNRVYTGISDDELYVMIPGSRLSDVANALSVIAAANDTLAEYHEQRRATLSSQSDGLFVSP